MLLLLHIAWTLAALPTVVRQHRLPASAAAWLALIGLLPVVGTLLYLLAGYREPCSRPRPPLRRPDPAADRLERIVTAGCGTRITRCNRLRLLHSGSSAFTELIAALQRARRTIHMEYYIFRDDRVGGAIAEILMRKARNGVTVRVIYDAVGSFGIGRPLLRRMREAGVRILPFEPLRFPWFTPRATRRNHRKIVVTDGKTAFLGGMNIAKYYLDGDCSGQWRDEHLRIEGDAVADLQRLFLTDWALVSGERLDPRRLTALHSVRQPLPVQIAWAGGDASRTTLAEAFAAAIAGARHRVRICSPYFLPPAMLFDALQLAARGGVRVEAMIPACSDSRWADRIVDSYVDDLLAAGVELYRYEKGFLHAKVLLIDDRIASVGTANLDHRSMTDNWEVTAFIRGCAEVAELSRQFDRDLRCCRRIRAEEWRPSPWRRLTGDVLRLASPLM